MIKIIAVGDIFLGDYTISLGYGIRSSISKLGYEYHLEPVKKNIVGADILFGNLETVISDNGVKHDDISSLICRGEKESAELLKKGSFNVLNVANNHILQHGAEAYYDTIRTLKGHGVEVVGERGEGEFHGQPVRKEFRGVKIGILGYSFVRENFQKNNILYAFGNLDAATRDIQLLKRQVDHVIVSCHWGIEYIDRPSPNIRSAAREMADAGASLILGHHPHVVQGIEKYNKSLIFYSLGNFLFDFLWSRRTRESFIANISIMEDRIGYDITPVYIDDTYRVVPMSQVRADEFRRYVDDISDFSYGSGMETTEDGNSEYYLDAHKIFMKYQKSKALYLVKNIYRTDPKFIKYILSKIFF